MLISHFFKAGRLIFNYTGYYQTFTVPIGVTSLAITTVGASGGDIGNGAGKGYNISSKFTATPGTELYVYVGGQGQTATPVYQALGGWNGGGSCGKPGSSSHYACGGGGGASDVRSGGTSLTNRIIVAGGGGGSSGCAPGGDAGYFAAGKGGPSSDGACSCCLTCWGGGGGATETGGGESDISDTDAVGKLGVGGSAPTADGYYDGGGGGGYYGGGAGCYAGGGGGSSYSSGTNTVGHNATNHGNGTVIIR